MSRQHPEPLDLFAGGGELGALMRATDWARTPLGPPADWPQSLKTCVRIVLTSRQPMFVWWGDALINLYNDAYKAIVGGKHPGALGQPASVVWREIWDQVGPRAETAMRRDEGTYDEALLLIMERYGYPEETYYTFSYSPVPNDRGGTGGIICANTDDTRRIIGERQLALLRELGTRTGEARSVGEACRLSAAGLATNPCDLPFALLYLLDPARQRLDLAGSAGIPADHPAAPPAAEADGMATIWPFAEALRNNTACVVDLAALPGPLPSGTWDRPPHQAAVLPLVPQGETGRGGVLVAGLNPYRQYDEGYQGFLGLVAGQVAAGIANAHAYEQERRRAEALAEIDRAKTVFFSNVSHEFRTPLTLMLAPLEDALNDPAPAALPAVQRERLDVAHRNALRLLKLVNTLLDFSRIEAGRVQASYRPVDLAGLTADLAAGFRSAVQRAGLFLQIDCTKLPEPVHVDRDMWEKVVLNLLSNAFKFTFEGGLAVTLGSDGERAVLAVRDTGVGIPAHELPRVFERFHRIEGQRSRSFEGSGIGLALVHELVRLHGGTIAVDSEPGQGTVFTVAIPFGTAHLPAERIGATPAVLSTATGAEAFVEEALRWLPDTDGGFDTLPPETPAESPAGAGLPRPRVLLADDNADMRDYVRRLLGQRYNVTAVPHGQAALEAICRQRPDLVVSDVMMPVLDGFGLLRAIRADPALRDLPVILLSARAGEEARSEGLEAGADDYLTKPFSAREMLARVGTNLALTQLRQEVMQAAVDSAERLRQMFEQAPGFMCVLRGPDLVFELANAAYLQLIGARDIIGRPVREVLPELAGQGFFELLERVFHTGQAFTGRSMRLLIGQDEALAERFLDFVYQPLRDHGGTISGIFIEGSDVTERVHAEQALRETNERLEARVAERTAELRQALNRLHAEVLEREQAQDALRQAQKMEAIGQLTGGIAHDFNNLLTGIAGSLELMQTRAAQGRTGELGRYVTAAMSSVTRASALTHRLLAFARRQALDPRPTNVNRLVAGLEELIRRTVGPTIEVETVLAGGLWPTLCDANQLESALLNLCINARDAMPEGGRLTIETANAHLDEAYAATERDIRPGQYVALSVSDTGTGMPPEVVARAFDPFFTTKPIGQGTGLGLSMLYGFVKQSEGHVRIYSEMGQGTTLRLYLPRHRNGEAEAEPDPGTPAQPAAPRAEAGQTVLVVEDEPVVRALILEMLADLGYAALEASDGPSGLRILQSKARVDLLVTDVGLPGLNGRQLADAARERRPDLKVLFITGYAHNAAIGNGVLAPGMEMIAKPFALEAMAAKVRAMIEQP